MSITREVQNGLQLSAIVEVVSRACSEIAGNGISTQVLGHEISDSAISTLIAARLKKKLSEQNIGG
jgi:hypothetical protein